MKFDCYRGFRRRSSWHRYFVIWPVEINGACYWLQWVWRKGTLQKSFSCWEADYWTFQYKLNKPRDNK
mgnify:CR=1 FL=1